MWSLGGGYKCTGHWTNPVRFYIDWNPYFKQKRVVFKMKNPSYKTALAELLGIILGDGSLHKTEYRVTIVGSLEDYEYYQKSVLPLFAKVFGKSTN